MGRFFALITIMTIILGGCMSPHTQIMADTPPEKWGRGDKVSFYYENQDTISLSDFDVLIRYDERFVKKSIDFEITAIAPDSTMFSEQIQFDIDRGQAKKTSANFHEIQLPYRQRVLLSQRGIYCFEITPLADIEGVWAAGINF